MDDELEVVLITSDGGLVWPAHEQDRRWTWTNADATVTVVSYLAVTSNGSLLSGHIHPATVTRGDSMTLTLSFDVV